MSAIGVSQPPRRVVVVGKEERCVGVVAGVFVEQTVHGPEERLRLIKRQCRLAPQAGLQICHQQSCSDPFAGNIPDDHAQPLCPAAQEIEVISSHLPRWQAEACVFQRFQLGLNLRKQPRLHLLGDFQFMGGTAFGFEFLGMLLPSQLQASSHLIESLQSKRIPVRIFEPREYRAPVCFLRGNRK